MINKNLIYNNDILYNKLRKSSYILNIDTINTHFFTENILKEKKIKLKHSSYDNFFKLVEKEKFDFVIFYDLFSQNEKSIQQYLDKGRQLLKENGYIILINIVITSYSRYIYHPFSYIQKYIFGKSVYLTELDNTLNNYNFRIVNLSRLYNLNIITFPIEYFCVIIN